MNEFFNTYFPYNPFDTILAFFIAITFIPLAISTIFFHSIHGWKYKMWMMFLSLTSPYALYMMAIGSGLSIN